MFWRVLIDYTELIAQKAFTLWGNVHSCTKLFNVLNIRSWWHEWWKSQNTTPHTLGISLCQQSRVMLSSADSSSVPQAWQKKSDFAAIPSGYLGGKVERAQQFISQLWGYFFFLWNVPYPWLRHTQALVYNFCKPQKIISNARKR